jgi:hypothetical protein
MATTYTHAQIGIVDASGNVNVIYPITTGADVSIDRTSNANLPTTATTAQKLANALGALAFKNIADIISTDGSTTSTTKTWSSSVINSKLTALSSNTNSHTSNKSNPHNVTAAQVGAPGLQSGVALFSNLGGIGLSTNGGQYWQLWNLQEGNTSNYWTAFVPTKDNVQDLGYSSLRMRAVHAVKLNGDWGGGYVDSSINIANKLLLKADGEGGNIRFTSKNGLHHWEMDACLDNSIRLYHGSNGVEYDKGFTFNSDDGYIYSESGRFITNVDLNVESLSITSNYFNLTFSKSGNIKFVHCSMHSLSTMSNGQKYILGTVDSRFLPYNGLMSQCLWITKENYGFLLIDRDGTVSFNPKGDVVVNAAININIAYI